MSNFKSCIPEPAKRLFRNVRSFVKYYFYTVKLRSKNYPPISFMSNKETVDEVVSHGKSLARFGDGELGWVLGREAAGGYQDVSPELSSRLKEVLQSDDDRLIVGVLKVLNDDSEMNFLARAHWREFKYRTEEQLLPVIDLNKRYADSSITRPYIDLKDKSKAPNEFDNLKRIWKGKKVLLVEGRESRLGVGNDLFSQAMCLNRFLAPSTNAFSRYDAILSSVERIAAEYDLVLLALGPTATVLAYDLCRDGIQAVDIGHIDNEYEWMLMGATRKVAIPGKNVDEVGAQASQAYLSDTYESSIVGSVD
ncbi:MAG: GT-D fold domain-containing glycosyltransferase [Coriobacteriaceae bacterium]|nr:GT-D fold domain-containing glycosyltransferase [Coriobacteriaceae bacterium]